jgi:hypothetical protein
LTRERGFGLKAAASCGNHIGGVSALEPPVFKILVTDDFLNESVDQMSILFSG